MSKSLYITSLEARSGKAVAVLGIMEQLSGEVDSVGFFRPVVPRPSERDRLISLVRDRYGLPFSDHEMCGCTLDSARALLSAGKQDELYSLILDKYKALESRCDFVLCAGTDYTDVSAALEFDFNVEVARNLGSPLVPIVNGFGREAGEIVNATRVLWESLQAKKCEVLAVLINRVESARRAAVQEQLKQALSDAFPAYVLPEKPLLEHPTVREVARALDAEILGGTPHLLDGEVKCFKIGAMELPHFLEQIEDGSLIITPGDRSDIIIGAIAADVARVCPRIAGIVLTGGIKPPQTVQRVMNGLGVSPPPVMSVEAGTFLTASKIASVRPAFDPENERKITAVVGMVESSVDVSDLLRRAAVSRSDRVTPLMFQHELIQKAKAKRRHIVLAEGTEERVLRAAEIVLLRDVCDITLLGNAAEVMQKISALGLALEKANIVDPATSDLRERFCDAYFDARKHKGLLKEVACDTMGDVSYFGTMMVQLGIADGMVSGAVHTTAHTIRPALEFVRTKKGISIVSSVFFMCLADRVLVYGDCAVNPDPTAEQLADIAISSAGTAAAFGIEPRIAMLSYSTGESGSGPDVDKVREATGIAHQRRPDLKIEGPIQYDAAVDATVAKVKLPKSDVAGRATVLIFPDLNTGNNAYKAVQRAAGAIAIGPVLQGLNKPVNDLSRGALVADIVNTIAITAIQAQE